MRPAMKWVTLCWIFPLLAAAAAASAQDTVTTSTGEKMVGEIKKVEKDVLTIETAYSDSDFKIEWDKVVVDRKRSPVPGRDVRRAGACPAR